MTAPFGTYTDLAGKLVAVPLPAAGVSTREGIDRNGDRHIDTLDADGAVLYSHNAETGELSYLPFQQETEAGGPTERADMETGATTGPPALLSDEDARFYAREIRERAGTLVPFFTGD